MAEYIEREALLQRVNRKTSRKFFNRNVSEHAVSWATYMINTEPAADVAPVVRCRECKHRTKYGSCGHPRHEDTLPLAYPNDFCSYGERKEGTE